VEGGGCQRREAKRDEVTQAAMLGLGGGGPLQKQRDLQGGGRRFFVKLPHLHLWSSDGDPAVVVRVCIVFTEWLVCI
jgi:hypothetical protein